MKQLTINRARTLGKDMNAKGIVILAFGDDGEFQAASYGRTKQDCGRLGKWLDGIYDAIESGEMAAPFTEQQSPERLTGLHGSAPVSSEKLYWHCDCGINEPAQPEYERGASEPCVHCVDGVARVVTITEAAAWEQARCLGRTWRPTP